MSCLCESSKISSKKLPWNQTKKKQQHNKIRVFHIGSKGFLFLIFLTFMVVAFGIKHHGCSMYEFTHGLHIVLDFLKTIDNSQ